MLSLVPKTEAMDMNNNTPPQDELDNADLYALGALSPSETAAYEAALSAGTADQQQAVASLETAAALAEQMAAAMPAPRRAVKHAIMSAIAAPEPDDQEGKQVFLRANEGEWVEMVPGITVRVLHTDTELGRTTFLARLAPGAVLPAHRHVGLEECLVLEGELYVDGHTLGNGDFTASYSDKVHLDTHSDSGCLLLLSSPMSDEFLDH